MWGTRAIDAPEYAKTILLRALVSAAVDSASTIQGHSSAGKARDDGGSSRDPGMRKDRLIVSGLVIVIGLWLLPALAGAQAQAADGYLPVHVYDPARHADQDIQGAVAEAGRTGRNVLIKVGGNWCIWCRIMDNFFHEHADLEALLEKNYVVVYVNFSPENKNEAVLSRYPKVAGYPHLFVLDGTGKLLQSEDTSVLEEGKGYNAERMREFLLKWAPEGVGRS